MKDKQNQIVKPLIKLTSGVYSVNWSRTEKYWKLQNL